MPDYGCFTQSWTNYGIVLPLISHIVWYKSGCVTKRNRNSASYSRFME